MDIIIKSIWADTWLQEGWSPLYTESMARQWSSTSSIDHNVDDGDEDKRDWFILDIGLANWSFWWFGWWWWFTWLLWWGLLFVVDEDGWKLEDDEGEIFKLFKFEWLLLAWLKPWLLWSKRENGEFSNIGLVSPVLLYCSEFWPRFWWRPLLLINIDGCWWWECWLPTLE